MAKTPSKSKEMREFAESLVRDLRENPDFDLYNTEGLATSLVRQWVTNDGTAAIHIGFALLFMTLTRSPLGALSIKYETSTSNWLKELVEEWKVNEDDLKTMIDQFNLTQNAEITNTEGLEIRWYVKPKERIIGVDHNRPPDGQRPSEAAKLVKVAEHLEKAFNGQIPEEEIPILAHSVMEQWKRFNGHAAIFTEEAKLSLIHQNLPNGGYTVTQMEMKVPTRINFEKGGVPASDVIAAIAQINLGKTFPLVDKDGEQLEIWHDPFKNWFMRSHKKNEMKAPPIVCPGCGAVLGLWNPGINTQICGVCGRLVSK